MFVATVYEDKLHKETCIHIKRHSKEDTQKKVEWGTEKTYSRESFHAKVFTGPHVYSLSEYKSHKETWIVSHKRTFERGIQEGGVRQGQFYFFARVVKQKYSRGVSFTPNANTSSQTKRPVFI